MKLEKTENNEKNTDRENYESIYDDYLNQPQGDLDDYIFGADTERKKHSEK
ncbi:MAG: hypothetical protein IKC41_03545 [Clostridia bacterium]|nr:hypothetical protein [Clostridia bacterium]MBR2878518.1 hypothetical protein [Clostridia bacterium]MBR2973271.1 hypothetical protein [Clostridia bacterium]MBR3576990.1 hypothetical protein [Clostridia bacterium]